MAGTVSTSGPLCLSQAFTKATTEDSPTREASSMQLKLCARESRSKIWFELVLQAGGDQEDGIHEEFQPGRRNFSRIERSGDDDVADVVVPRIGQMGRQVFQRPSTRVSRLLHTEANKGQQSKSPCRNSVGTVRQTSLQTRRERPKWGNYRYAHRSWFPWLCIPGTWLGPWSSRGGRKRHRGTSSSRDPSPCCAGARRRRWRWTRWRGWSGEFPMAQGFQDRWLGLLELLPIPEPGPSFRILEPLAPVSQAEIQEIIPRWENFKIEQLIEWKESQMREKFQIKNSRKGWEIFKWREIFEPDNWQQRKIPNCRGLSKLKSWGKSEDNPKLVRIFGTKQ